MRSNNASFKEKAMFFENLILFLVFLILAIFAVGILMLATIVKMDYYDRKGKLLVKK